MPKLVKYGITSAVILVAVFIIAMIYNQRNYEASFIKEIDPKLSAEDRKIFEDRVFDARNKINESQTNEDKFGWYMQLGFNLQALGNLSEAQEAFENAIELQPDKYNAHSSLAELKSARGDYEGANENFQTALRLEPNFPDIWKKYLLFQEEKLGANKERISSLYSEAIVKTNNHIDMITAYAGWLGKIGNYQTSKEYWQKAKELNPTGKKLYDQEIKELDELLKQQQ